mmetsp:Transcript_20633/g.44915  ORF Transcript_20633/g.44915 Transcript_20633/m.44915 type:complete len:249 (+) Transcript_20633:594-1340(+)
MDGDTPGRHPGSEILEQVPGRQDRAGFHERPEPGNTGRRDVLPGPQQAGTEGRSQRRPGAPLRRAGAAAEGFRDGHGRPRREPVGVFVRLLSHGRLLPPPPRRDPRIRQLPAPVLAPALPERRLLRRRHGRRPAADPHGHGGRLFAGRRGPALPGRGRGRRHAGPLRVRQVPPRGAGHGAGAVRGGGLVQPAHVARGRGGHPGGRCQRCRRGPPAAGRSGGGGGPGDGGPHQSAGVVVTTLVDLCGVE